MNVVQRITKNATMLLAGQVVTFLFGFLYVIYIARYLGAEQYGILSFALAFVALFVVVADLGLGTLLVREVARQKTRANMYFSNVIVLKLVLGLLMFGLIILTSRLVNSNFYNVPVVYLTALYVILMSFSQAFYSLFQAHERMEFQSLMTITYSLVMFSGVIVAIALGTDVIGFALLYALVSLLILGINVAVAAKFFAFRMEGINRACMKHLTATALPFSAFSLFQMFNYKLDSVLLAAWSGAAAVGLYNAAYGMVLALYVIPSSLAGALFPFLSRRAVDSRTTLRVVYMHAAKLLAIVTLPLVIGTIILAESIILFLYGPGYTDASNALRILALSLVPTFLYAVLGTIMLALNKERRAITFWAVCAAVNFGANVVLIPRYSYIGASIVTVISELTLFLLFFNFVSKEVGRLELRGLIQKPLVASFIMGLILYFIRAAYLPLALIFGASSYIILLVGLRALSPDDITLLKQIITPRKTSERINDGPS
jgi:O-antigen/teichoic acid export membrane protein